MKKPIDTKILKRRVVSDLVYIVLCIGVIIYFLITEERSRSHLYSDYRAGAICGDFSL
ncbi:hypothetical protein PMJ10TS2_24240 [Paenibacillus melissococcoides]